MLKSISPLLAAPFARVRASFLSYSTAASSSSAPKDLPLAGVRVLDLTRVLAGPYCTMILGDLGANVIKIENPKRGDDTRAWGPPWAPNRSASDTALPESAYFLGVNRNKRSVTVNLKSVEGVEIVRELAKKSDVLVENYVPGKLHSMGLGYEQLSEINPRLIYCSITGYGQTGPHRTRAGYDVMIEAEAGLMHITGERDGPPVKVGVAITDLTTGLYAQSAIVTALYARHTTQRGQHIDCSLLDSQIASLANIASNYLIAGQEAERWGTSHASIVPYQVLRTQDSYIMIGAGNDTQFSALCNAMELPHLPGDPRFSSNSNRVKHRSTLIPLLEARLRERTTAHWLSALEKTGIPYAPINNIQQTFDHPQVKARHMVQEVDHPRAGRIKLTGIPVKYSQSKPSIRLPPPTLGQHTHEVLRDELGFDLQKIEQLRVKGVI
ncbi:uncharacterized protein VTP21DRAFT_8319 [Calcarisporiella thermophila]|uniref:uncharacterized protein n=1 Tax=Calcarisporiella thermophila TaxID=911321 RepID=UPI0037421E40